MHHALEQKSGSAQLSAKTTTRIPRAQPGDLPAEIVLAANRRWQIFPFLARSRHASNAATLIGLATCDIEQLARWAAEHVDCNWAVATGRDSGIFVLEFDGVGGLRSYNNVAMQNEDESNRIEQTLTSVAGCGDAAARYSFFRWPTGWRTRHLRYTLLPRVRLHGEDDSVLIPPSIQLNGARHVYLDPEASVLKAPLWLVEMAFEPEDGDGESAARRGLNLDVAGATSLPGFRPTNPQR